MPFETRKAIFDKLLDVADVASLSKEERMRYDATLKQYRDYYNTVTYAKEEGFQKGMEKGLAKGKIEGKMEALRVTARNLKAAGIPLSVIQECTGLSVEEIEKS